MKQQKAAIAAFVEFYCYLLLNFQEDAFPVEEVEEEPTDSNVRHLREEGLRRLWHELHQSAEEFL